MHLLSCCFCGQSLYTDITTAQLAALTTKSQQLQDQATKSHIEAQDLERRLQAVTQERDTLALERHLHSSKDTVQDDAQIRRLQQRIAVLETRGLQEAHEALAARDDVIRDLSERLQQSLGTLEQERSTVHVKRRAIIFPNNNNNTANNHDVEAKRREAMLLAKVENLEKKLRMYEASEATS